MTASRGRRESTKTGALVVWLAALAAMGFLVGEAALVLAERNKTYESVAHVAATLLIEDVDCRLAFVPARSRGGIMGTPISYEEGWCRTPDDTVVDVFVWATTEQADLYREETIGGNPRGVWILLGPNWEVQSTERATAHALRAALGGYFLNDPPPRRKPG